MQLLSGAKLIGIKRYLLSKARGVLVYNLLQFADDRFEPLCTACITQQLFLGYFRSLIQHECSIDVELKTNVTITGKLQFIDNNMCMLLGVDEHQLAKLPAQFAGMVNGVYIRGSTIRAVYMPKVEADLEVLSEMCQKI